VCILCAKTEYGGGGGKKLTDIIMVIIFSQESVLLEMPTITLKN
jgi:hypothetical protein